MKMYKKIKVKPLHVILIIICLIVNLMIYYSSNIYYVCFNILGYNNKLGSVNNNTLDSEYLEETSLRQTTPLLLSTLQIKTSPSLKTTNDEFSNSSPKFLNVSRPKKNISEFACYKNNSLNELPDILQVKPTNRNVIVFHETSCKSQRAGRLIIHPRQACSIESAALQNPNHEVYVLIAAPTTITNTIDLNDRVINSLMQYENIKFFHVDINTYFENTLVQELFHSGKIEKSPYHMIHLGDVMRFVTMWRFGAIYLDLDIIVLKSLDDLEPSFSGLESRKGMASGVIRFANDETGRKLVEMCLKDLNENYQGSKWSYNANGVLSRLAQKICGTNDTTLWNKETCDGFEIYNSSVFYPLEFLEWEKFFYKRHKKETMELVSEATVVHLWNHMSSRKTIRIGTNASALELIAQRYCPQTYSQLDEFF